MVNMTATRLEVDRAGLKRNCSHSAHFDQLSDSGCYMATPLGVIGNRSPIFVQEYRVHSVDFTTSCLFALRAYVALSPPTQVVCQAVIRYCNWFSLSVLILASLRRWRRFLTIHVVSSGMFRCQGLLWA